VTSERVLKFINLSIAVLLVLLIVAAWWMAWRPLPQTRGTLHLPLSAEAAVVRDSLGVPHITAASISDAVFVQGFVTAQDRLWQMDALRRLAAGELAEIVGTPALDSDRGMRRVGMRRIAEMQYRLLSGEDRALFAAYARGVNSYIESQRGRYPLEFTLLGYDPRPWTTVDSLLAALYMNRELTLNYLLDLRRRDLLTGGDPAKVEALFPPWSGQEAMPGSNAWAISGAHTASGKPILANDTHLKYSMPSTWYMVHLTAPGLNVTGFSLPGIPAVIIGHNDRIAWGITNLGFDVSDLYEERFDAQSGHYLFAGNVEQARLERDFIRVKGAPTEELDTWVTRHGPIVAAGDGQYYALRWTAAEPGAFRFPILAMDRATNWTEFTAALAMFVGPGQNVVYADRDGNIGYHAMGMLPVRRGWNGSVPVDGSSGQYEWQGFIPFDSLPSAFNPAPGRIVTANQNPFPRDYPYTVNGVFASPYRSNQIRNLLTAHERWTPNQMVAIEKDVYSGFGLFLARRIVAAYDRRHPSDPALADAAAVLRKWNGQMEIGQGAPMLVEFAFDRLRFRLAQAASPGKGAVYSSEMSPAVVENVLRAGARGWFTDLDGTLLKCASEGIDEGARSQGSRVSHWNYGKFNELTITQPVDSRLPLIGSWFNIGPVFMSGGPESIKQVRMEPRLGPSERMVVDLGNLDNSLAQVTIGQSGHRLSSHYEDQWDAYYNGRGLPMPFHSVTAKETLRLLPEPAR
jgi:penicillin amidase